MQLQYKINAYDTHDFQMQITLYIGRKANDRGTMIPVRSYLFFYKHTNVRII